MHIGIVSVPVTDQDAAITFYKDMLGFELVRDDPMGPKMRWVQMRPPGGGACITLVTWFESMPAGSLTGLVLESANIDADHAALKARGLDLEDVTGATWGRFSQFKDIDGNGWVLAQNAEGY